MYSSPTRFPSQPYALPISPNKRDGTAWKVFFDTFLAKSHPFWRSHSQSFSNFPNIRFLSPFIFTHTHKHTQYFVLYYPNILFYTHFALQWKNSVFGLFHMWEKPDFYVETHCSPSSQSIRGDDASCKAPSVEPKIPGSGSQHGPSPATVVGSGYAHFTSGDNSACSEFHLQIFFRDWEEHRIGRMESCRTQSRKMRETSDACTAPHKT